MQCAKTLTPRTAWYFEGNSKSTPRTSYHCPNGKRRAGPNAVTAGGVNLHRMVTRDAGAVAVQRGGAPEAVCALTQVVP